MTNDLYLIIYNKNKAFLQLKILLETKNYNEFKNNLLLHL